MSTETPQSPAPSQTPAPQQPQHHFQHDPERTELEKALSTGMNSLQPYYNYLIAGGMAAVIGIGTWFYLSQASAVISTDGWAEFATYRAPSDFKALAEKYPKAPVAHWALLEAGRRYTTEGIRTALTNRTASDESLSEGRSAFKAILDQGDAVPADVREEALFGLANCLEALSGENIDETISAYKTLITEFPETRHKRWAEARLADLEKPSTEAFYVWFREQKPSPQDRTLPSDLTLPFDHPPLPQLPPGTDAGGAAAPFPEGESPAAPTGEPAKEMPAPGTDAPATESTDPATTPAEPEKTPAEPAAETKPEPAPEKTEQPATETPAEPAPAAPATEGTPAEAPATTETPAAEPPAAETPAAE